MQARRYQFSIFLLNISRLNQLTLRITFCNTIKQWGTSQDLLECSTMWSCSRIPTFWRTLLPLGWRQTHQGPLKQWYYTTTLHSITTQKTCVWIFTAAKTSNLTQWGTISQYSDHALATPLWHHLLLNFLQNLFLYMLIGPNTNIR